ncbi:hypothetical protein AB4262_18750 [Vibrio breoganii]
MEKPRTWLCDFFHHVIKDYVAMPRAICLYLNLSPKTSLLWYLIDEDGGVIRP